MRCQSCRDAEKRRKWYVKQMMRVVKDRQENRNDKR